MPDNLVSRRPGAARMDKGGTVNKQAVADMRPAVVHLEDPMTLLPLGIDIAQNKYDVALLVDGRTHTAQFANTPDQFAQLTAWLQQHGALQVHACLEATGRYGDALAAYLHAAGHRVSRINPARAWAYARSKLTRNKTDRVDAALLADFCRTQQPRVWTPPAPERAELQALVQHLEALKQMRTQELNRQKAKPPAPAVTQLLAAHLAFLDDQIAQLQAQIQALIDAHPTLSQQQALLVSIPGIGAMTAARLLAIDLLNFASTRAVAAYAGLSPSQHTSGTSIHRQTHLSKVGNADLRKALYLPAVSAIRWNPVLADFAKRLTERGKAKMVIVGAAMRKLLCLAYGVLKSGRAFDPLFARSAQAAA
jgi:transposase